MENVKIPTSESYQKYLISRLSDLNYAAVYLETYLEEPAPEPELLQLALHNVAEALLGQSPDRAEFHQRQLDEWLAQPGSYAIHGLANWLNELGLKLTVTVNGSANGKSLGNVACGEISGNVTQTITQLQNSDRPHAPELAELLTQLQAAIESDPDLSDTDKTEALEQVSTIAKAGQNPQDSTLKKLASTAIKVIKGTAVALPATATLVEAVNKLLPPIASLLGL